MSSLSKFRLKYIEMFDSKSDAMKREYEIKQLTRSEKFKLMEVMEWIYTSQARQLET